MASRPDCFGELANLSVHYNTSTQQHYLRKDKEKLRECDRCSYFNKCNGSLGKSGSVSFMFDHQCNFTIASGEIDPEELELELIDFGAEEVFSMNDASSVPTIVHLDVDAFFI